MRQADPRMAFDSEQVVEELKRHTSLSSLIGEYVSLKKAGRSHKGLCPFHDERTPSFHVHDAQGFYHCFGCGASGDAISFLREHLGYSFREALEALSARTGIELPEQRRETPEMRQARSQRQDEKARFYQLNARALGYYVSQLDGAATNYLYEQRNLTEEMVRRYEIGWAPDSWDAFATSVPRNFQDQRDAAALGLVAQRKEKRGVYDRFRGRIMFPVYAIGGKIAGFSGRTLSNDKETPKYVNSSESSIFKKSDLLYGLHQAQKSIRSLDIALLCEGQVDVITLAQHGFPNAVAPMGTALTENQCRLISRFTKRVVLLYDGDAAGRKAALAGVGLLLQAGISGRVVQLPDGSDPDSYLKTHGANALQALIESSPALFQAALQHTVASYDGTIPGATRVIQQLAPLLAMVPVPEERNRYVAEIARVTGMLEAQTRELVRSSAAKGRQAPENVARPPSVDVSADARRPAPPVEKDLLALILQHPDELLGHWMAGYRNQGLTHPGIKLILEMSWEITQEYGRFDAAKLLERLRDSGRTNACAAVVRMLNQPNHLSDKYEMAFVEIAETLKASEERRQLHVHVRSQTATLDTRGQLEAMRAFASNSSEPR